MREWTQEHGDTEDLSWRWRFERWPCLLPLWWPGQVTRKDDIPCTASQKPSFTQQQIDFSKFLQKRHPKVDSAYQEKNLSIWFTLRRGVLCDIHTALEGQERVLVLFASSMLKSKCWVFSWASIREPENFSKGSVIGEWCRFLSLWLSLIWPHHSRNQPASYFIVCWSDGDSYWEVCLSQIGRSCVFKGKFC